MSNPVILVVGAGPGVGGSVARRFGREGYDVALISLEEAQVAELAGSLEQDGITAAWAAVDITDPPAFRAAVDGLAERYGRIDVLHFNPSAFRQKSPLELTPDELAEDMRVGVGALLTAVQAARPHLPAGGRITVTGSMAADEPSHEAASLGVQKAGVRNLVRSIDAAMAPDGVRAVSVTVQGTLSKDETDPFHPDRVAEAIHAAATQPEAEWQVELPYGGA